MVPGRGTLALLTLVVAAAIQMPDSGWNAAAHYALTQSLASGTPRIDRHLNQSGDIAWSGGHYYAAKSPGLAFVSVPAYWAFDALGQVPPTDPGGGGPPGSRYVGGEAVWQLNLVVIGFFLGLLLLIRAVADGVVEGLGTAVAVMLGTGTILLPFATSYFSHVPSATLGFASFALLLRDRSHPRAHVAFLAGLLAGLAVFVEAPLVLIAAAVGVYAACTRPFLQRGLAFAGGTMLGLAPLAAYDTWAFGSPFNSGYAVAVKDLGASGHDVIGANSTGFFGLTYPHVHALESLLVSERGLFVLTPITLVALVGLPLLARRGLRGEAVLIAAVSVAMLLYNASYYLPFGGYTPGPRFLIPLLPFLALPLVCSLRAWPRVTLAAALVSSFWMVCATAAQPLLPTEAHPTLWVSRLFSGSDLTGTIFFSKREGAGVFVFLVIAAATLAAAATLRPLDAARAARPK
jgi:hypothetical protein